MRDSKCFKMHLVELMYRGTIEKQGFEIRVLERATVVVPPSSSTTAALLRSWDMY